MRRLGVAFLLLVSLALGFAVRDAAAQITFVDLSNNDPTYEMARIRAHGHAGVILKVNQGIGFLDHTFYPMAKAAQRAGLAVGGYDFDQEYTAAETYAFVNRLHAAGIYRTTTRTFPPVLDVEFGVPSRAGLEHQLAVLFREYGRAAIYSGAWYYLPHFGCFIPPKVTFWLSGYPTAQLLCGLPGSRWVAHQFTDHGYNGVNYGDLSRWRGSSAGFQRFIQAPVRVSRAQLKRQLYAAYRLRTALRTDIIHRRCHHPAPHNRAVCRRWLTAGAAVNRRIRTLHAQGTW